MRALKTILTSLIFLSFFILLLSKNTYAINCASPPTSFDKQGEIKKQTDCIIIGTEKRRGGRKQ
ncbi:MAG: hypothetical protein A2Z09_02965 [Nitrospirae bacterium RBG_16_43_8]|nr:MAG: hypothetical protein A2Z09_02965 [Nitrospirae bacterium RBG_16_43_8]